MIQEAMMRGRVVVATDVGGPAEIITDGENGYIAEAASLSYVLNALERWWKDRETGRLLVKRRHLESENSMKSSQMERPYSTH